MCGICGIVAPARAVNRVAESTLLSMREALLHRGPDDAGVFIEEGVGLGFRRLSIVDIAGGHQPMQSASGRFRIVYNGEVYNHPDLMKSLTALGANYRTRSDTETILHLHEREGVAAVPALRGMFAYAIWDKRDRTLLLARDRFGIKPLYYWHAPDGALYFASEIKSILASEALAPELNLKALPDFLANHAPSADETLFTGIRRLPPGSTMEWRDGEVIIDRYWELPSGSDTHPGRSLDDLVEEWRERFAEAVQTHLMSDVPLGVFLSGGIDSAAITAVMSRLVDERVQTFSVAFAERQANELTYARLVAEQFGTNHHEVMLTPSDFFADLPRLLWHEDEPIAHPSSIALNRVSRLAAEHVKVVLTGEGSDETLAGYNRYRVTLINQRFGEAWTRVTPRLLRAAVTRGIRALPSRSAWARRLGRTFLALPPDLDSLYFDNFAVFSRAEQSSLLSSSLRERLNGTDPYAAFHGALARVPADRSLLDRLLYADTSTYLHELLMKQDQMSMAASIESRVPFLDHPLAEFSAALPQRLKLDVLTTKAVLRRAMKGVLPAPILARKKMGFPVPVGTWFRGAFGHLLDDFVLGPRAHARGIFDPETVRRLVNAHRSGEPGHEERLWALLNFEIWQRVFFDREPLESIQLQTQSPSSS